jgi:hypothetical protein
MVGSRFSSRQGPARRVFPCLTGTIGKIDREIPAFSVASAEVPSLE